MIVGGKKNQIHIVENDDGWCTKKANAERASTCHDTQKEAIDRAIEMAKNQGDTEVIIHGKDGKIRESNTYNRKDDPKDIKG